MLYILGCPFIGFYTKPDAGARRRKERGRILHFLGPILLCGQVLRASVAWSLQGETGARGGGLDHAWSPLCPLVMRGRGWVLTWVPPAAGRSRAAPSRMATLQSRTAIMLAGRGQRSHVGWCLPAACAHDPCLCPQSLPAPRACAHSSFPGPSTQPCPCHLPRVPPGAARRDLPRHGCLLLVASPCPALCLLAGAAASGAARPTRPAWLGVVPGCAAGAAWGKRGTGLSPPRTQGRASPYLTMGQTATFLISE